MTPRTVPFNVALRLAGINKRVNTVRAWIDERSIYLDAIAQQQDIHKKRNYTALDIFRLRFIDYLTRLGMTSSDASRAIEAKIAASRGWPERGFYVSTTRAEKRITGIIEAREVSRLWMRLVSVGMLPYREEHDERISKHRENSRAYKLAARRA